MTVKIGINGFGRIGRSILRASLNRSDVVVAHINDLSKPASLAHLLKYDSVHGTVDRSIKAVENTLEISGLKSAIVLSGEKDPSKINWKASGVDIVFECTGIFKSKSEVMVHINAGGAKKVIVSAPADDEDLTVVFGVNDQKLMASHQVVSNGSCTTNCLAPVAKVLNEAFGIEHGLMTTVHSYTNDQRILDVGHSDLRRARAAALNMIPTSTGAAKAIGLVLPELKGKLHGISVRVPTPNVSLVDVTFRTAREVSTEKVNHALKQAAEGPLKGILGYTEEPLVSSDFNGGTESSYIDASMTCVVAERMVKVLSWYDNETGFSCRMLDVAQKMGQFL